VHQPIASGKNVHKRPELSDADDAAVIDSAHFCLWRINNGQDASLGIFHSPRFNRADGDNTYDTVVIDADIGAGLLLDGVDNFALGPNNFSDFVERNSDRSDLRCCLGH
jgi:hypothetical protein